MLKTNNLLGLKDKREEYEKMDYGSLISYGRKQNVPIPNNGILKGVEYYEGDITPREQLVRSLLDKDKRHLRKLQWLIGGIVGSMGFIGTVLGIVRAFENQC